jgi:hypothetical protein
MPEPLKKPPVRNMDKWHLVRRRPGKAVRADYSLVTEGMKEDWQPERRKLQPWVRTRLKKAKPGARVTFAKAHQLFVTEGSEKRKKPRNEG